LWQWTTMGIYKTLVWEQYAGWVREDEGWLDYKYSQHIVDEFTLVDEFEDMTGSISFFGDCAKIEVFEDGDKDAWNHSFGDQVDTIDNTPGSSTLYEYGLMPWEDNCVYENGDIQTAAKCHWACKDKNGCPGKTANCIQLMDDARHDTQGFYMIPEDGIDIGDEGDYKKRLERSVVDGVSEFVLSNGITMVGLFV